MSDRAPSVGVIGLGAMGSCLATRLLSRGREVIVHDQSAEAVERLKTTGATAAADPAYVAERAWAIVTSLPDAAAVREVALGPRGVVTTAAPGTIIVDTSTISPAAARELAADLAHRGVAFLDAPVSGGPEGAATGMLSVMVGGDAPAFERARPILEEIGRNIAHCGASGSGQVCKACNQLLVIGTLELVAEALVLASASGLEPRTARGVLLGGFASSRVLEHHGARMIERDFEPGGKAVFNLKDIEIIESLASASALMLPGFAAAARQLERLVAAGRGGLDNSALITLVERPEEQSD